MNEELNDRKLNNKFDLFKIDNLQNRKLNEVESKTVCIPYDLFADDTYKQNELKFLLHVYIYMERSYRNTVKFCYSDFFEWMKISNRHTRAKNKKEIEVILKEMQDNNLIEIRRTETMYICLEILEQFTHYAKESFYNSGFVGIYLDEVDKIMNCDTSKYKGVSNGLLLYTYACLVGEIKSTAHMRNRENPCYYVKGFYCNLCDEIYNNKAVIKNTVQCLQDLGLIYATTPKRYKKENGRISCGATIFALTYVRDKDKKIEYYGENYIDSVIEYAERR